MLRNYLIVALRIFTKQKGYVILNTSGLAIGLAGAILIFAYIIDELSYDTVHPYAENTYRIGVHGIFEDGNEQDYTIAPAFWSDQLKEHYPNVQERVRMLWYGFPASINFKEKEKIVLTEELYFVDPSYIDVFYFDVIAGDKGNALREINSIVLNQSAAEMIFGDEDPIGKILTIKHIGFTSGNELDLTVTAVFKDYPSKTNLKPSYLVPMQAMRSVVDWRDNFDIMFTGWLNGWMDSYVVFKEGTDIELIGDQLVDMVAENVDIESVEFTPFLRNITDLHFDSEMSWYNEGMGEIKSLRIFGYIAVFLILIACINYMNLATARAVYRSREVGLRKVVGSKRSQLILQFLNESFITTLLSLVLALLLVGLALPVFNNLAQKDFAFASFFNIWLVASLGVIVLFVSLVAGSYPAFYLSGFNPVTVLKAGGFSMKGSDLFRKTLVIFQFSISLLMLICSGVLMKQISFMKSSKLNEQGQQMVCIRLGGGTAPVEKFPLYRNSILQDPEFTEVTVGNHLPRLDYFGYIGLTVRVPDVSDQEYDWSELNGDYNFPEVFNLELVSGREFIVGNPADSNACLINEAAVKNLGIENEEALGLRIEDTYTQTISTVIGVVSDFPYRSVHQTIGPLRINARPAPLDQIVYVKLPSKSISEHIQILESKWKEQFPGIGFDYWFLDDEFNRMYESEIRVSGLSESFSVIAILIACLGLFGLASYMVEQRTNEIGIRKVFGASVKQVIALFLNIFLKMLVISAVIAGPIAYFLMNKWLQQFAYHIAVDWKIIASAIGIMFGLTILTISYELFRASRANPVDTIRHE